MTEDLPTVTTVMLSLHHSKEGLTRIALISSVIALPMVSVANYSQRRVERRQGDWERVGRGGKEEEEGET